MNLKQNLSDKIQNFSTRLCITTCSRITDFTLVNFLKNFIYRRNFTNTVRVCRATLSRRRPALPDPKQDPDPEWWRNFLKSRIRIRIRIRNKSFRIHNPGWWWKGIHHYVYIVDWAGQWSPPCPRPAGAEKGYSKAQARVSETETSGPEP
jgi:hypothetical protein